MDFVFLISVHCMLQSSGGSDAPPASSVRRSGYPSPLAKRHCHRIEEPSGQGSGGDGPSHRAPSPPLPQEHAEEPMWFSERTTASGKVWFRCPLCPDAMEMDNMCRLIEHALNFKPDDPSSSSIIGLLANTFMVRRRRLLKLSTISLMIPPRRAMIDVVWGHFFFWKHLNLFLPFPLPHRATRKGLYIYLFLSMHV